MNFKRDPYVVYVKIDDENRIIAINSSAFLPDVTGWVEIDRGFGDRFHHAQGNYFDKPIYNKRGICRYKFVNGTVMERSNEEIESEIAALPIPEASTEEFLLEMAADHEYRICLMELGLSAEDMIIEDEIPVEDEPIEEVITEETMAEEIVVEDKEEI